ncbi:tetratricopeptide repeat protein [Pseudobacteriovorax antillogorgiicola]|uniref:Uncharacterized protein n=1 Tax=Pseudobacteriovorax antillogorgiicola TaxID=1513793 RepID=A0A1Y6BWE0_9BACT|nr:hypothetical protein [Pseudobacteriovorax antillogorgiicola]TCS50201.1 hypothetical protein EDD56_11319 [Pseudobacteriovorax antillogorgiicola]SMF32263.1 hypothetical protein SAMN06296036_11018 [Pseudobacteriovorax antillogorgiicola]
MVIKAFAFAIFSISFLTSCVTSSGDQETEQGSADIHVHQTSGQDILSELNRDQWINIRKTSNSDQMKLYSSLGTREWDVAINDARAYLENHPKDMVALQVLSIGLAMKQNFSLSAYYSRLIEKYHPGQLETANIQGLAILNQPGATFADFRRAMVKFEEAFEGNNREVASGLNLGHLHLEMGNGAAARDVFKIVQNRCGNCTAALLGFGVASSRIKDYEESKEAFETILDRDPDNLQAKYYIAIIENYGFQKKEKAVKILADVVDDKSTNDLDIKRRANFLMRRLEAQIYSEKKLREINLDHDEDAKDSAIVFQDEDEEASGTAEQEDISPSGIQSGGQSDSIMPANDSGLEDDLDL